MHNDTSAIAALAAHGIIFDGAMGLLPRRKLPAAQRQPGGSAWADMTQAEARMAFDAIMAQDSYTPNTYAQPGLVTQPNAGIMSMLTTYVDPKVIEVLLAPTKAEEIYGVRKVGDWTTQTAAFPMFEMTGEASAYGDFNQDGRSDMNINFPQRQSFNAQTMTEFGDMEIERYGLARIDAVARKNVSSANTLNRLGNLIYFYGVQGLQNYGGLNDPSLAPALTPAVKVAGGTSWANALPTEILADVQTGFAQLNGGQYGTGGNLELDAQLTLAISPVTNTYIVNTNSFGLTARDLLLQAFPNLKIKTAPQYQAGSTFSYQLIADEIDGQKTMECAFNEKMRAHRMVMDTSSFRQKKSAGWWGTIIYRSIGIASMTGI